MENGKWKAEIDLLELFSGIGGFTKGFVNAGYTIRNHYYSEIDKYAIANYKYNFENGKEMGSVVNVGRGDFGRCPDVITFGSPCQDFSLAGKRAGLKGQRSSLIGEAIRIVDELRPSVFIWENVKGVFSSNGGSDFWAVIAAFANIGGYRLEWQLLNTMWFLPQNRERIYLIGHLDGRSEPGVFPIGKDGILYNAPQCSGCGRSQAEYCTTIKQGFGNKADDTYVNVPNIARTLTVGGHSGGMHSDMTVIQMNVSKESNGAQPYIQNRVYDSNGLSPTIDSAAGRWSIYQRGRGKNKGGSHDISPSITSKSFEHNHSVNNLRRLTEIECERLQGFPDDWTRYGVFDGVVKEISRTQRYNMVGNAVTVDVVKCIAERLKMR